MAFHKFMLSLSLLCVLQGGGLARGEDAPGFAEGAVDASMLEDQRGGTDAVLNDIQSSGMVANNSAAYLTTGNNIVTEGSFAGSSGFSTVIQNSGNNVLIQSSTIINLQLTP